MTRELYDFVAIGLGPFNLSLACLSAPLPGVRALFLDKKPGFDWHPGLLIEASTLQNPFLADLVSLADPRSEYSYLNYCKQTGRIYSYYMRENHYLTRAEYNRYCKWVAARLPNLRFNSDVQSVLHDPATNTYLVTGQHSATGERFMFRCRKLVLGLGSQPALPACCDRREAPYIHSADYLRHKPALQRRDSITVIGSGQSAAEVFHDLLRDSDAHGYSLAWITRSPRFFQMENTKLTLELISPDYTDYFHDLPEARRRQILAEQSSLYKGINASLINQIYDLLDEKIHNGTARQPLRPVRRALPAGIPPRRYRAAVLARHRRAGAGHRLRAQHPRVRQPHPRPHRLDRTRRLPRRAQLHHRPRRQRNLRAEQRPAQPRRHQSGPGLLLLSQLADPARPHRPRALRHRAPHRAAGLPSACRRHAAPPRGGARPDAAARRAPGGLGLTRVRKEPR